MPRRNNLSPSEAYHETERLTRLQSDQEAAAEIQDFKNRVYGDGEMVVDRYPSHGAIGRRLDPAFDETLARLAEWSDRRMSEILGRPYPNDDDRRRFAERRGDPPPGPAGLPGQLSLGLLEETSE